MRRFAPWLLGSILLAAQLSAPRVARADASQSAAAQTLFEEGKKLVNAKKYAEACPKFAESQRLDPGAGTLLHLGNCYERLGMTASAWATFIDAAAAAKAQNRTDWAQNAKNRAADLEKKLSRLTINVGKTDGVEVRRDGVVVQEGTFGTAIAVDPGKHEIEATAPKKKTFTQVAIVKPDGDKVEITVPTLEDDPEAIAAAKAAAQAKAPPTTTEPAPVAASEGGSGMKIAGYVLAGAGVVGLGVGTWAGLTAKSKNDDAKALCPVDGPCSNRAGVDASDAAKSRGTISTVAFIAGAALVAGGIVLIVIAPSSKETHTSFSVAPSVAAGSGGLVAVGRF